MVPSRDQALELFAERREVVAARDGVDGEEADIVAVVAVFVPGIAEADDQMHRRTIQAGEGRRWAAEARSRCEVHSGRSAALFLGGVAAAGAASAAPLLGFFRSAGPTERRWWRWSGPPRGMWSDAPAGSLIDEMWTLSPTSMTGEIDFDRLGDVVGIDGQVERVVDDVQHATALDARGSRLR